MKRIAGYAALCTLLLSFAAHAVDPLPFKDDAQRLRFQHLTSQLRCLVCQDESLNASDADLAKDLRHQIFKMMQEGTSNAQIKQYLVARSSDFVLYDPPVRPATWLLWFGPFAVLALGGCVVAVLLRRRVRPAQQVAPQADDTGDDW